MPYMSNSDLPVLVRRRLSLRAQDLYREAFNKAWAAHPADTHREETAHRVAWAAVAHRARPTDGAAPGTGDEEHRP